MGSSKMGVGKEWMRGWGTVGGKPAADTARIPCDALYPSEKGKKKMEKAQKMDGRQEMAIKVGNSEIS